MEPSIAELNQKIDLLTEQVAYLAQQAHAAELAREERTELLRDAMPIANDMMRLATEQFQEVEAYVDLKDLLRLLKKLVRATPFIEQMLDQIDGLRDLLEVVSPMVKDIYNKAESVMDDADHKGYFTFAKGGMKIMDNIVTSFSEDDIKQLGDNVVLILRTVKQMTQPELMTFLNQTVIDVKSEVDAPVDISIRALMGQMRDPNVRRGLGLTMRMLRTVGAQAETK
ncbi:MAG TPA: DUF1641 domain-containing protein [Anaerolineae bacterium]